MSIASIINEQIENGKTLTGLARELGLSHSMLSLIRDGKRSAGGKVIKALVCHPDTRGAMLTFLSNIVTSDNSEVSNGDGNGS